MVKIPQNHALRLWLSCLYGSEHQNAAFEVRCKPRDKILRRVGFYPNGDQLHKVINAVANRGDAYVGVAPRREVYRLNDHIRSGGLDAIANVWCVFADADTPDAVAKLKRFRNPKPSILIQSGNGLHAYWPLRVPLSPANARRANRRIALHLDCDMNATDAARIMRPPGTFNYKSDPPLPVVCTRLDFHAFDPREVVSGLPDPPEPTPNDTLVRRAEGDIDALLSGACRKVREAESGNRNAALNWAAFALGKRIADGDLDEGIVRGELYAAAIDAGLSDSESTSTISKGIAAGVRR